MNVAAGVSSSAPRVRSTAQPGPVHAVEQGDPRRLRIVVLDYAGHPAQVQLSRVLAGRGHSVLHLHCPACPSGKGALDLQADDSRTLRIEPIDLDQQFNRYEYHRRVLQEWTFAERAARRIGSERPDVVVLSNVPLLSHSRLAHRLQRMGVPMVLWQQDIRSRAISSAGRHLPLFGRVVGRLANRLERQVALTSARVVAISSAFVPTLRDWGVSRERITVLPNWAPLDEMPVASRQNPWARTHGLHDRRVVLYSGTLGLKHDPSVLFRFAEFLRDHEPHARMVVVSEGRGREWLQRRLAAHPLPQLVLLDYQPYDVLPEVLGAADILVTLLEPDAGAFSVPSKVLNYLCAGRALLGVIPPDNAAAEMINESGAGVVVGPGQPHAAIEALQALLADDSGRAEAAAAGRAFAERAFDIEHVTDVFEGLVAAAAGVAATRH